MPSAGVSCSIPTNSRQLNGGSFSSRQVDRGYCTMILQLPATFHNYNYHSNHNAINSSQGYRSARSIPRGGNPQFQASAVQQRCLSCPSIASIAARSSQQHVDNVLYASSNCNARAAVLSREPGSFPDLVFASVQVVAVFCSDSISITHATTEDRRAI